MDRDPIERLRELDADQLQALADLADRIEDSDHADAIATVGAKHRDRSATRRELLAGAGAIGAGAILGGAATGSASASHGGAQVGTDSERVDLFSDTVDANSVSTDSATINDGEGIGLPTTSTSINPGYGSWTTTDATRPVKLIFILSAKTDGTSAGRVDMQIDWSGGTSPDINENVVFADGAAGSNYQEIESIVIDFPPGAQFQIINDSDPTGSNSIQLSEKMIL